MCAELFEAQWRAAFVLRANLPPDGVAAVLAAQPSLLPGAEALVDFGCGRIVAAMPSLSDRPWSQWCDAAREGEGHVVLEKAPAAFRAAHDVFGPLRQDGPLLHRIQAALDLQGVFAPARLPERK